LPASVTAAIDELAFELIFIVAVALPVIVGAKVKVYATVPEGRRVRGNVGPVTENSLLETLIPEICNGLVPGLEMLIVCVDFCPTTTVWKLKELAERDISGACFEL
jgi:hypothetical protein